MLTYPKARQVNCLTIAPSIAPMVLSCESGKEIYIKIKVIKK